MAKKLTTSDSQFSIVLNNDAIKYAEIISNTAFVPSQYKGKPGDILIAIQMGSDFGLSPIQALQSIAVINGRPSLYGDAVLAICQSHPRWEYMDEEIIQDASGDHRAICKIKRKGEDEYKYSFTVNDAKKAGLWGKPGPWTQYPKRMLELRARGFALRNKFADALKGFITYEEAIDYPFEKKEISHSEKEYISKADKLADLIDIEEISNSKINDDEMNHGTN